jgi:hypothetical protein
MVGYMLDIARATSDSYHNVPGHKTHSFPSEGALEVAEAIGI